MYVKIQVIPESREERVTEETPDRLVVSAREKAERGLANRRLLHMLSAHFGTGKRIRIISGHHSSHKIISVD